MKKTNSESPRRSSRQIVAIIGIILLVLLYLATLVAAVMDNTVSHSLFFVSLYATMIIPILIWIYTWLYGKITGRHTITDSPADIANRAAMQSEFPETSDADDPSAHPGTRS